MTTKDPLLVVPSGGKLYYYNDTNKRNPLSDSITSDIITTDGHGSRLVIAINDKIPGPTIEAYKNQQMIIHVRNLMHTDSTTIHFHGIHQRGTPHADGVAFISQCPILPGETFTYRFTASPHGSSFYHAHIGDQRSMGLYGGLIFYPRHKFFSQPQVGFTVLLQDWNHNDEPETLYQRMLNGI
jgi:FtsP/CotA-like multicopper oxidase with cupredoxin domain